MADHPLRPATDRCLGGPLPRQLANRTRAPPSAINLSSQATTAREHIRYQPKFPWVVPYRGAGSHALLTRAPLPIARALDLHVLGLPPAFVLSQDQTLKLTCPPASLPLREQWPENIHRIPSHKRMSGSPAKPQNPPRSKPQNPAGNLRTRVRQTDPLSPPPPTHPFHQSTMSKNKKRRPASPLTNHTNGPARPRQRGAVIRARLRQCQRVFARVGDRAKNPDPAWS